MFYNISPPEILWGLDQSYSCGIKTTKEKLECKFVWILAANDICEYGGWVSEFGVDCSNCLFAYS